MTLMTKRKAYQTLLSKVQNDNQSFRIRISDKKGRCRTYGGKAGHTRPRADFLKELNTFSQQVKSITNGDSIIDIEIPDFQKRPEPVIKGKTLIESKYNKTCKCQIKKYDAGCTYWLNWNNGYWISKGAKLKEIKLLIDKKSTISKSKKVEKLKIEKEQIETAKTITGILVIAGLGYFALKK